MNNIDTILNHPLSDDADYIAIGRLVDSDSVSRVREVLSEDANLDDTQRTALVELFRVGYAEVSES